MGQIANQALLEIISKLKKKHKEQKEMKEKKKKHFNEIAFIEK